VVLEAGDATLVTVQGANKLAGAEIDKEEG
jgi:hypothetical protein